MHEPTLQGLVDAQHVRDVITLLFVATDERDWATVRACLEIGRAHV